MHHCGLSPATLTYGISLHQSEKSVYLTRCNSVLPMFVHQVEGEVEYRLRQKAALQTMLKEKMLELDRQNLQYQSLLRIESEQLALIDRLSNSETLTEQEAPRK